MNAGLSGDVLDLLVDGPSHVSALHAALRKVVPGRSSVSLGAVVQALKELDELGLVRLCFNRRGALRTATEEERDAALVQYLAWMDPSPTDEPYEDAIGLWCEITARGREAWREAGYSEELDGVRWALDEDRTAGSLKIRAESRAAAERVLHWWLNRSPGDPPPTLIGEQAIACFKLKNGETVEGGVELTYRVGRA